MRLVIIVIFLLLIENVLMASPLTKEEQKITYLKGVVNKKNQNITIGYNPFSGVSRVLTKQKNKKEIPLRKIKKDVLTLIAIMRNMAFIDKHWVKKGDKINGYIVKGVFSDHVSLTNRKKTIRLKIAKPKNILNIRKSKI